MSEQTYTPIACGLHENYQFAVMRRAQLDLAWRTEAGLMQRARVLPLDVFTKTGAEYLRARIRSGEETLIRLDRILSAHWAENGASLNPQGGDDKMTPSS